MQLSLADWMIIILFFVITMAIGLYASKKAGKNVKQFFLSGNDMPWWLLGISMVATTFSADTPNLVTDIVRNDGVSGNWVWWAFLLTGMLTVFVYAKMWRRAGIVTDLEFYELRYSGKAAKFLRGFRAIYLGVVFNVIIMGTVLLAGIKMGGIMFDLDPATVVLVISVVTVVYAIMGGLRGVILTDFFQFILSMLGMIVAAIYILSMDEIGGLSALINHENVVHSTSLLPDLSDKDAVMTLLIIPFAIQWWSVWYPGAEPGGGGYVAQRMLSARDEQGAVKATLLFNIAHYALRPWPWILIALASLIIFPDLESLSTSFPNIPDTFLKDDLAFPAMLTLLPSGLMGLLIAALIAALMSTISTHLNWGSSYIVNDFYGRYIEQNASEEKLVLVGRISTVLLMLLASLVALYGLSNAKEAFDIILLVGAGTGLIFILRWFWWRVNAYAEIVAMVVSFAVALYFHSTESMMPQYLQLITGIGITTIAWVATAFLGPVTDRNTLIAFFRKIRPHAAGWKAILPSQMQYDHTGDRSLASEVLMMTLGCLMVYAVLLGMGMLLYNEITSAVGLFGLAVICGWGIKKLW